MSSKIVIFEKDAQTTEVIKGYLSSYENVDLEQTFSDYNKGYKFVRENKIPVVLFSMTEEKELCYKIIKKLFDIGVNVIALSEDYTTSNIIQLLRSGAKDFVSKPVLSKDLLVAIVKCTQEDVKVLKKSQIISVFSNKGGVGKTAIATNLAYEFARLSREKVALVDLNLPIGDVTTFLVIKPIIDISEIVNNNTTSEKNLVFEACQQYKDSTLYVLAEPPHIEQSRNLTPNQIVKLFNDLREK
ncbi:AAA family ATPase, partial [bacterium]|nr:AAA family ATPase [bacterium]